MVSPLRVQRVKRQKSTLPEVAITRTELQHENELLRIANADKTPTSA
jgi:hypothetical protein